MSRIDYRKAAPKGMEAFGGVHTYIETCGLPRTLIDLVYLRVSLINGCPYCIGLHTRDLQKNGVGIDKIVLVPVWHESGTVFSVQEKAALQWAEAVTRLGEKGVADADYAAVAAQFSEKEVADLTVAIGLMNAFNRMAISFRRGPDGTFLE